MHWQDFPSDTGGSSVMSPLLAIGGIKKCMTHFKTKKKGRAIERAACKWCLGGGNAMNGARGEARRDIL